MDESEAYFHQILFPVLLPHLLTPFSVLHHGLLSGVSVCLRKSAVGTLHF